MQGVCTTYSSAKNASTKSILAICNQKLEQYKNRSRKMKEMKKDTC